MEYNFLSHWVDRQNKICDNCGGKVIINNCGKENHVKHVLEHDLDIRQLKCQIYFELI